MYPSKLGLVSPLDFGLFFSLDNPLQKELRSRIKNSGIQNLKFNSISWPEYALDSGRINFSLNILSGLKRMIRLLWITSFGNLSRNLFSNCKGVKDQDWILKWRLRIIGFNRGRTVRIRALHRIRPRHWWWLVTT